MPLMQFVNIETLRKQLIKDYFVRKGLTESQTFEIYSQLKENPSSKERYIELFGEQTIRLIKKYYHVSWISKISIAVDVFFGWIIFSIKKLFKFLG
jgi:hypothetical protein